MMVSRSMRETKRINPKLEHDHVLHTIIKHTNITWEVTTDDPTLTEQKHTD